jgi:hypothetical protein
MPALVLRPARVSRRSLGPARVRWATTMPALVFRRARVSRRSLGPARVRWATTMPTLVLRRAWVSRRSVGPARLRRRATVRSCVFRLPVLRLPVLRLRSVGRRALFATGAAWPCLVDVSSVGRSGVRSCRRGCAVTGICRSVGHRAGWTIEVGGRGAGLASPPLRRV